MITDDGVGIVGKPLRIRHGMGLHIMSYRAAMIGGRLEVQRKPIKRNNRYLSVSHEFQVT